MLEAVKLPAFNIIVSTMKILQDSVVLTLSFVLLLAGLDIRVCNAQHWQQVTVPTGLHILTPYFLNRNYGFLFTPGITDASGGPFISSSQTDPPAIYRTL